MILLSKLSVFEDMLYPATCWKYKVKRDSFSLMDGVAEM